MLANLPSPSYFLLKMYQVISDVPCLGYMCCPAVLDKDGVSAAVITAEMASFLATRNLSLSQQLKAVYDE